MGWVDVFDNCLDRYLGTTEEDDDLYADDTLSKPLRRLRPLPDIELKVHSLSLIFSFLLPSSSFPHPNHTSFSISLPPRVRSYQSSFGRESVRCSKVSPSLNPFVLSPQKSSRPSLPFLPPIPNPSTQWSNEGRGLNTGVEKGGVEEGPFSRHHLRSFLLLLLLPPSSPPPVAPPPHFPPSTGDYYDIEMLSCPIYAYRSIWFDSFMNTATFSTIKKYAQEIC